MLRTGGGLLALLAASVALHTGALRAGYWIDEAISVGIASRPVADIPSTLLLDGSPPLYYVVLHGWIGLAGDGEAATRSLSLLVALGCVPVAWAAGRSLHGAAAGWWAAVAVALSPFVGELAQETRGYTLVVLGSVVASWCFALAYARGRVAARWPFAAALTGLLYLHSWSVFLAAAFCVVALVLPRRGRVGARHLDAFVLVAAAYAPWLPSLLAQARHTGAPWSSRPGIWRLVDAPAELLGPAAAPLVVVGAWLAVRPDRHIARDALVPASLLGVAALGLLLAWTASQVQPAWADRYLAVLAGPLVLGLAGALARAGPRVVALGAAVAIVWVLTPLPVTKSNVRTVAQEVRGGLRPGDVVLCTQPEQVPVLARYLPRGLHWRTLTGPVGDITVTDWRDGVVRLRATRVARDLPPVLDALVPGQRLVLATPIPSRPLSGAPWMRAVRWRSALWRRAVGADARLVELVTVPRTTSTQPSAVRITVFERRAPGWQPAALR